MTFAEKFPELNENQRRMLERELVELLAPTNGYIGMDDLDPDAYKAQARYKKHITQKIQEYINGTQ